MEETRTALKTTLTERGVSPRPEDAKTALAGKPPVPKGGFKAWFKEYWVFLFPVMMLISLAILTGLIILFDR